jgi:hypothetical protein
MSAKSKKTHLSDMERFSPDEIFDDDGQLVASKLEICILTKCHFSFREGKTSRLKVKANWDILKQLNLYEIVRKDTRKGNKDIFLCFGHLHQTRVPTATTLKDFLQTKLIPEKIRINSRDARTATPSRYWRKRDMAKLKCADSLALPDHNYFRMAPSVPVRAEDQIRIEEVCFILITITITLTITVNYLCNFTDNFAAINL